jgi:hypothetical protein
MRSPFFDNSIMDGRDTLAAPRRFSRERRTGCFSRERRTVRAPGLIVDGVMTMNLVWFGLRCSLGVAVMYLSTMRYSYACELVPGRSTTGDREPEARQGLFVRSGSSGYFPGGWDKMNLRV